VQGDEALEGAEGNGDNFGIFRCAAYEDGVNEVFCKSDSESLVGISERDRRSSWIDTTASGATTMLV
jgi:hypothetical protein